MKVLMTLSGPGKTALGTSLNTSQYSHQTNRITMSDAQEIAVKIFLLLDIFSYHNP